MPGPNDEEEVFRTLSQEDPLGVVLRAAVYVEHQMDMLIEQLTASKEAVKRLHLDYAGKIDLCLIFGLDDRFRPALAALGSIRNKFAHTLKSEVTADDATSLYAALSPGDKQIVQSVYERLRKRFPKRPRRLLSSPPLDLFVLIAVSLRSALIAGRREAEGEIAPHVAGPTK